jgi:hypothetical protein
VDGQFFAQFDGGGLVAQSSDEEIHAVNGVSGAAKARATPVRSPNLAI